MPGKDTPREDSEFQAFVEEARGILAAAGLQPADGAWCEWSRDFDSDGGVEFLGLRHEVEIGGSSGGDCWGGTARDYSTGASAEFPKAALDAIVKALAPGLGWQAYAALLDRRKISRRSVGEYYGNGTDYEAASLSYQEIFDALSEDGALKAPRNPTAPAPSTTPTAS